MARNNTVNLREYRGWPHVLMFWAKTLWFYTLTRPDLGRLRLSFRAMRDGLRGDFTGHERYLSMTESVAVVIVTFNRADLLTGMLDGLAAQTRKPDAVFVIDNASTDHTREVLEARAKLRDIPLELTHSSDNLGGAGGFSLGVRQAYAAGHDRIWLVDDDVVPAPDCLEVLMALDEDCLAAVREDTERRAGREGRRRLRPAQPADDPPEARQRRRPVRRSGEHAAAGRAPERVLRGLPVPPPRRRPDRAAGRVVLHLLRRRRLRRPRPAGGVPDLGHPRRGAGAPARLRPAARPGHVEGVLHVPEPLRRPLPVRREPAGPVQAMADRGGGRRPQPGPRRRARKRRM